MARSPIPTPRFTEFRSRPILITPPSPPPVAKTNLLPGISDLKGVSAVAASIIAPLVPVTSNLVFGELGATYIVIGSFGSDFTFTQQSFSNLFNMLSPTGMLSLRCG